MNNENKLIKKETESIFTKIKNYIRNIFVKKQPNGIEPEINIQENNKKSENSFFNSLQNNKEIEYIQNQYELGKLKEEELKQEEKEKLIDLYKRQISALEKNIEYYKANLESYKNRIIKLKSKLNNGN